MVQGDLLSFETRFFRFSVWCADIEPRRASYNQTHAKRRTAVESEKRPRASIKLHPAIALRALEIEGAAQIVTGDKALESSHTTNEDRERPPDLRTHIELPNPLFFENLLYHFEWEFNVEIRDAHIGHRLRGVNDGFRFVPARKNAGARLQGTINTGNDVGWLRLPLHLTLEDGSTLEQSFSFEVLPTKMLMHSDLSAMYRRIDTHVPLWRFKLAGRTEQRLQQTKERNDIPLFWLANFKELREQFESGLEVIAQSPHRRLQTHTTHVGAHKLKHRVPRKVAERARQHILDGRLDKKYRIENKRLSVDTPENRFIKMAVSHTRDRLQRFEAHLRRHDQNPEEQLLSDEFFNELRRWQQPLTQALNHSFLKEVSPYAGRQQESLVLQQKTGYNTVYRTWQQLKLYLDALGDSTNISLRSVAQIYEVWCFLTLAQILENDLGFERSHSTKATITQTAYFEYEYAADSVERMEFRHQNGVKVVLKYEPTFSRTGLFSSVPDSIHSFWTLQRPDIYLEATFPGPEEKQFVWLFDAKYRIATAAEAREDAGQETSYVHKLRDFVPPDAINQMHRYRDALIRIRKTQEKTSRSNGFSKSRPVVGAFCLYPGFFAQCSERNPYQQVINEVGIGAFALLPSTDVDGKHWLTEFLKEQLGLTSPDASEQLYLQESHRIPADGMLQVRYPDLLFVASLGEATSRSAEYFDAFERGDATHYHMPVKTFALRIRQHIAKEIRYLALAPAFKKGDHTAEIQRIWPVTSVQVKARRSLDERQTGRTFAPDSPNADEPYYLFTLGESFVLRIPFGGIPQTSFRRTMAVTTLSKLQEASDFSELEPVYGEVISREFAGS